MAESQYSAIEDLESPLCCTLPAQSLRSAGMMSSSPSFTPELFRETDTVLGTFLAVLWDRARLESESDGGDQGSALELLRKIRDAAEIYAMARTPARALENSALGPEYVDEMVAITQSSSRLQEIISDVVRSVSQRSGGGLLVLPVDDADLSPLGVSRILRDLRIIASVPGVLPIVCASEADLRTSWLREQHEQDKSPTQANSFRRFLEKLFPYRLRFDVEPLQLDERVGFTPIGTEVSLFSLTERFDTDLGQLAEGNNPLRMLRHSLSAFSLTNPLPPNPRALIQYWDCLDSAIKSGNVAEFALAARRVVHLLSEEVDDATEAAGLAPFAQVSPSADAARFRYKVDFSNEGWNLFISSEPYDEGDRGIAGAMERPSNARVQVRKFTSVQSSLLDETGDNSSSTDNRSRQRMTPSVTSAALTIQEIVARSRLLDKNIDTPLFVGTDEFRFLQKVQIAGLQTDDLFLTLPDLATYSTVLSGAGQWNRLVDLYLGGTVDFAALLSLTLTCSLAHARAELFEPAEFATYGEVFAAVTEEFLRILGVDIDARTEEQRRFIEWYTQGPPLHWHTALLPVSTIAEVAATWSQSISILQPGDVRAAPGELLRVRMRRILDAAESSGGRANDHLWVAGYLSAVGNIADSQLLVRLSAIYPAWRQRWTIAQTGSASSVLALDVPSESSVVFSPYPTATGIELYQDALARLRVLRSAASQGKLRMPTEE